MAGKSDPDTILAKREEIGEKIKTIVDIETNPWGIKVTDVKIKDIELPDNMKRAMAHQAEAERDRRARIILAEALIFDLIEEFLKREEIILDIGCGSCNIIEVLKERDFNVVALDIKNLSFIEEIKPILYNGKKMPFKDNTFDRSMILTVLHHTDQQKEVLKEAMRVTKNRIIVIEDIYTNKMNKCITQFVDSIINLEIKGHPHSNRTDSEWRLFFKSLGLKIVNV